MFVHRFDLVVYTPPRSPKHKGQETAGKKRPGSPVWRWVRSWVGGWVRRPPQEHTRKERDDSCPPTMMQHVPLELRLAQSDLSALPAALIYGSFSSLPPPPPNFHCQPRNNDSGKSGTVGLYHLTFIIIFFKSLLCK